MGAGAKYAIASTTRSTCPIPRRATTRSGVHGASSRRRSGGASTGRTAEWRGRPWHEHVIYEMHVGTFTQEGTFAAVDANGSMSLRDLGVTALELMPLAAWSRATRLGLRRRAAVRAARGVWAARGSEATHPGGARARADACCSTWSTTTSGRTGITLSRYAAKFYTGPASHALGRRDRLRASDRAPVLHSERAVLARGVSLRRPAHRRRARDARPRTRGRSSKSWWIRVQQGPGPRASHAHRAGESRTTRRAGCAAGRTGGAMERRLSSSAARAAHRRAGRLLHATTRTARSSSSAACWPKASRIRARRSNRSAAALRGEPSATAAADARSSAFCRTTIRSAIVRSVSG